MKKVSNSQINLFGGVGAVTQTEVMAAPVVPQEGARRLEGAYLVCDGCKTKSQVVYIPVDEVEPKSWHAWVKQQVGWEEDCPSCEDKKRFMANYKR